MVKNKKLTIRFFLKGEKKKKRVTCKIIYNRIPSELSLDYWFYDKEWDDKLQLPKNNPEVESELLKIKTRIQDIRSELILEKKSITSKRLKLILLGEEVTLTQSKHITLLDAINLFIDFKNISNVAEGTKESYRVKSNRWKEFINNKGKIDILLSEVDHSFIFEFDQFLSKSISQQYKKPLTRNYINKIHDSFIVLFNWCVLKKYLLRNPYEGYTLPKVEESDTIKYLSEEELLALHKIDLSYNDVLNTCKEIFLFACYTGLRISEAKDLQVSIIKRSGKRYIIDGILQRKTRKKKYIPLFKYAEKIYCKYRDSTEAQITGFLFPRQKFTKMNPNLKHIGALINVNFPLHFHVGRHTCATMLLSNGLSKAKCAEILGVTMRVIDIYAKITGVSLNEGIDRIDRNIRGKFGDL